MTTEQRSKIIDSIATRLGVLPKAVETAADIAESLGLDPLAQYAIVEPGNPRFYMGRKGATICALRMGESLWSRKRRLKIKRRIKRRMKGRMNGH